MIWAVYGITPPFLSEVCSRRSLRSLGQGRHHWPSISRPSFCLSPVAASTVGRVSLGIPASFHIDVFFLFSFIKDVVADVALRLSSFPPVSSVGEG